MEYEMFKEMKTELEIANQQRDLMIKQLGAIISLLDNREEEKEVKKDNRKAETEITNKSKN